MAIITTIIDALRRFGSPTQRSAIQRQDEQLQGKAVLDRRSRVARSELGSASLFTATTEPTPETIVALSEQEIAPIRENAALIDAFLRTFLEQGPSDRFLDNLDDAFSRWAGAADKRNYSSDAVVEIAGAAFGQFCVETLDMRWIRLTDEYGEAIAIQGRVTDFRAFPYQAISKRVAAREHGFFKPIYISLQDAARGDWKATEA